MHSRRFSTSLRHSWITIVAFILATHLSAQTPTPTPESSAGSRPSVTPTPASVDTPPKNASSPPQQANDKNPQPRKSLYSFLIKTPPRMPASSQFLEILSNTEGVDFKPYMAKLKAEVQEHWESLIPKSARSPIKKSGQVTIQFSLLKDGSVRGMELVESSGDVDLDRAALGAIATSSPFAALPAPYTGDSLFLRCNFLYNPGADDKNKTAPQQPATKK